MATTFNTITTPTGIAQYPWLSKPDTKFSEEGEYKVNVILTKEEATPLVEKINGIFADNVKEETKKNKGKEVKTSLNSGAMKGVEREWLPALADFRENFLEENLISLYI
jgi:hypothetical protein